MNPQDNQPSQQPRPMMDVAPPRPAPTENLPANGGSEVPPPDSTPNPQANPEPSKPAKPPKKKGVIIAIVAAVIVTLILISAAVYVYLRSQNSETTAPETTETNQVDDGRVGGDDVEQTIGEIDSALGSVNDSEDFGQNDLTNSQLGL